jgi:hypothetical protein
VEDDDLRDRREGEVGGVTVEDMKTMIWQTMIGLLDSMLGHIEKKTFTPI